MTPENKSYYNFSEAKWKARAKKCRGLHSSNLFNDMDQNNTRPGPLADKVRLVLRDSALFQFQITNQQYVVDF